MTTPTTETHIAANTLSIGCPTPSDNRVIHVRAGETEIAVPNGSLIIGENGHRLVPNAGFTVETKTVQKIVAA